MGIAPSAGWHYNRLRSAISWSAGRQAPAPCRGGFQTRPVLRIDADIGAGGGVVLDHALVLDERGQRRQLRHRDGVDAFIQNTVGTRYEF